MAQKRVVILRGISGSGKSTLARREFAGALVVSADDFFAGEDGSYNFDPSKLPQAHHACWRTFESALQAGAPLVVVDNTATTVAEVAPYVLPAESYGYSVEVLTLRCDDPAVAAARNTHGVPKGAVFAMAKRLDAAERDFPPWWSHQVREG